MGRCCSELSFVHWRDLGRQVLHREQLGRCSSFLGLGEPFPSSRLPQTSARGRDILGFVIFEE